MNDVDMLLKTTFGEMVKVMTARTVIGDPISLEDKTVIPLVSVSMGFGAGAGTGKDEGDTTHSGGAGGGIRIKPLAVVVLEKEGVRVEPISSTKPSAIEKLAEGIPKVLENVPNLIQKHKDKGKKAIPESSRETEKEKVEVKVE